MGIGEPDQGRGGLLTLRFLTQDFLPSCKVGAFFRARHLELTVTSRNFV